MAMESGHRDGPVQRYEYDISDPEAGRELISQMFTTEWPQMSGPVGAFRMTLRGIAADGLRVDRFGHSLSAATRRRRDDLVALELHGGRAGVSDGSRSVRLGAGDISMLDPLRPIELTWAAGVALRSVTLDLAEVRRYAEDLTGYPASRLELRIEPPIDPAHGRYWSAVSDQTERLLSAPLLMANPLLQGQAFRALATATLASFPNPALDALLDPTARGPGTAEPAVVRRAVEFIDANSHRDIDISTIAQATRISPRGLQHAFRRYRGTTPMRYLHRVRMEGAHADLQLADPTTGDTVAAIAARWGFAHPGRFSVDYRRLYGHPPSRTLHA